MDLHQLRVFQNAAKTGSFSNAGKEMFLSQSTVSQHIKQLETELGCHLFMRIGRRVVLTRAGEVLVEHCEKIFRDIRDAEMAVQEMDGVMKGKVRFASGSTTLIYQLAPVLELFQSRYPNIELVIVSDITDVMLQQIRSHRLDLALVMETVTDGDLSFTPLCREELRIALPSRHPLASRKVLRVKDLEDLRFILYEQKTVMRELIDGYFVRLGISPKIGMVMENIEAIKSLVGAGLGASILPVHAVGSEGIDRKVKLLRVEGEPLERQLGLVSLSSFYQPQAVRHLNDLLVETLGQKPPLPRA